MPETRSFKVLYIAGFARCGSTLLGSMLGQLDGFFNLGEMRMIWNRGLGEDRACGCGEPFSKCPVWKDTMDELDRDNDSIDVEAMARTSKKISRSISLPRMFSASSRDQTLAMESQYLSNLRSLYTAVASQTSARVLVDTSKTPMYGVALRKTGLDVNVVHLIRDPRAVAQSRLTPKRHPDTGAYMGGVSVAKSALMWSLVNAAIQRFLGDSQYRQVGYHEYVENPGGAVDQLIEDLGLPSSPILPLAGNIVTLAPTHSVFGNPGRFTNGQVEIRLDDRWKKDLSPARTKLVEVLTAPVRRQFKSHL